MSSLRFRCALGFLFISAALTGIGCGGNSNGPGGQAFHEPKFNGKELSAEEYNLLVENPFLAAKDNPQSTFSTSVDTASYSNLRRFINEGKLPPVDAVRIADMLNYFDYSYPEPRGDHPVAVGLEMAPCPWQPNHYLLKIALKAKTIAPSEMPPRNLVFLIDTSGSMSGENRLPLVKKSLELLVHQLGERDRVSIVTYAGDASLRLAPTPGNRTKEILAAIHGLEAQGSTNGGGGIVMAYNQAQSSFIKGGVNRVILATDGDFNVGVSSEGELVRLVEQKRNTGVYLTVLGYGMGNLKDNKLEQLAHHGNGHYAYIDSIDEARKVFVDQGGALAVVAKDVKLQVEFNHNQVNAYRLIGYENRVMRNEDFKDDAKDAGDMGSGHTCTALYEIVPVGVNITIPKSSDLKYQSTGNDTAAAKTGEWLTVRMRYKNPENDHAKELAVEMHKEGPIARGSDDFRFASSVAAFGMLLRESPYKGDATFDKVNTWARDSMKDDHRGLRLEFVGLVNKARELKR
ncbi:MAG: VWA domain-containing protein [Planctomycetes bacterium]|nr:VWA domain-containing protein [Planctomycetota bacterium]